MAGQSPYKTLIVSTLALMASGLVSFFYTFFAQSYPKIQSKIEVLDQKIKGWDTFHGDVRGSLKEIRDAQRQVYMILMERSEKKD